MDDGSNWVLELEEALLDEAPPEQIKLMLAGRCLPDSLRADVWSHCLETDLRKNKIEKFNEIYDHPDQAEIRTAAKNLVENLDREDKFQLQADAEAILTVHFKSSGSDPLRYDENIVSLLRPVIDLSLTKNEKFSIFQTVLDKFIPHSESTEAVHDLAGL